jgi:hypothetical protein
MPSEAGVCSITRARLHALPDEAGHGRLRSKK